MSSLWTPLIRGTTSLSCGCARSVGYYWLGVLFDYRVMLTKYLVGGATPASRGVTSLVTGSRGVGPALLIATQSFPAGPRVTAEVIAVGLIGSFLPTIVALEQGRRSAVQRETAAEPVPLGKEMPQVG